MKLHLQLFVYQLTILILTILAELKDETDAELIDKYTQYQKQKLYNTMSTKVHVDKNINKIRVGACKCMKYFECNVDLKSANYTETTESLGISGVTKVEDGDILGIVDIRRGGGDGNNKTTPNDCPHYFDICCDSEMVKSKSEPTPGPEEPKMKMKNWTHWSHKECGHRNTEGVGFKMMGATSGESQFGEFPWTVALIREVLEEDNVIKNVFICGGSLIHPQVILTAAHCVFQMAQSSEKTILRARVGEWDTQTLDEPFSHQDRYVERVEIHEKFCFEKLTNDIALLFLDRKVKLAPNVDTICLPRLSDSPSHLNGEDCFTSGWEKEDFGAESKYQEIMKKARVPIVPKGVCESKLRKTRLGHRFRLHNSFVCAGPGGSQDTCVGHDGSPLVCKPSNSRNYVQVGIAAWGIGNVNKSPRVYVNVYKFVPWILKKMKNGHFDHKFCKIR